MLHEIYPASINLVIPKTTIVNNMREKKIVICEYAAHLSLICIHIYVNTNDKMSSFVTLMAVSENLRKTKNINAQQTEY